VNAKPHIGHALEFIQADVLARYNRLLGRDVFFLTGTDEHGSKVPKSAKAAGKPIPEFVNEISDKFRVLTNTLDISNSHFIRTIEQGHKKTVTKFWKRCLDAGDIYKGKYEGLYCSGCENYVTESDLLEGKCPVHKTKPEKIAEENYFFKWSKYQKPLLDHYKESSNFVVPKKRFNEIIKFVEQGLQDISISRSTKTLSWGIPVPDDKNQVIYVWFDALINYLSGIGFAEEDDTYKRYWPADVHLIGKDILRFHAALWPAMLISAKVPLPKQVYVHGFIGSGGQKMSKSLGNVVDPVALTEKYGVDAVRYFLLREIPSDGDGDFTIEKFEKRYKADLQNNLGNLVSRVTNLIEKNLDGEIGEKIELPEQNKTAIEQDIEDYKLHDALAKIWEIVSLANKLVDEEKLWELAKNDIKTFRKHCATILTNLFLVAKLIAPFMSETGKKIEKIVTAKKIQKAEPLFPKID